LTESSALLYFYSSIPNNLHRMVQTNA